MGVDFYSCHHCEKTFADCGYYINCGNYCGRVWCSDECAEAEGVTTDEDTNEESPCSFCSKDNVEDYELLRFVLKKFKLTREKALKLWQEKYKKDKGKKKKNHEKNP